MPELSDRYGRDVGNFGRYPESWAGISRACYGSPAADRFAQMTGSSRGGAARRISQAVQQEIWWTWPEWRLRVYHNCRHGRDPRWHDWSRLPAMWHLWSIFSGISRVRLGPLRIRLARNRPSDSIRHHHGWRPPRSSALRGGARTNSSSALLCLLDPHVPAIHQGNSKLTRDDSSVQNQLAIFGVHPS